MTNIDRRISKTKKAIYQAFLQLLNDKDYEATTVQDIIDLADVGRSTFYCHYESKELLLDALCRHLFHHIFEREGVHFNRGLSRPPLSAFSEKSRPYHQSAIFQK